MLKLISLLLLLCAAAQNPAPRRPPVTGVAQIALRVSDLTKARLFYGQLLGYAEPFPGAGLPQTIFKVNDRQYVELFPGLPPGQDERLAYIGLETTDLEAMRAFLRSKGVAVPDSAGPGRDGNLRMMVTDPDGHGVEFIQYLSGSLHLKARGQHLGPGRIADRLLHVGVTVADAAAADRFYKEVLGFSEIWRGGTTDAVTSWINMRVPDGTDYIEYMLVTGPVDRRRLGVLHHLALQVPDIQKSLETLRERAAGLDPAAVGSPQVGRNNRWQLNLYDPDGSRTELMEPFTVR
ncbi:MAG TPA: VOC family protein [Blastocatellia bacterium]|jgi:catechol 2,3-dioxygenase-like lactoylglutathione lyase family enzyme|nr:VOC family protein [Blastocatellia bacterium]